MSLDLGNILSDGVTGLEIGGPIGGVVGAGIGVLSGLAGGGGSDPVTDFCKLLLAGEEMEAQDLEFQRRMDDVFRRFDTLTAAEWNVDDALMHIIRGVR